MKVIVQFLGQARHLASSDRVVLDVEEGASVDDLVASLLAAAPENLRLVLLDGQQLRRSVMAIRGEETINPATRNLLKNGDELSLLPPMSGG